MRVGPLRERITIQSSDAPSVIVSSLTRSGAVATALTETAHGRSTGDYVLVAGASPGGYNGRVKITVTGATSFTYAVAGSLSTPATGTITATYQSDAQGGRAVAWSTLVSRLPGAYEAAAAGERLAPAGDVAAVVTGSFRIRARADVTASMRVLWTPLWPPGAPEQTLEIHGIRPVAGDGRFMVLDVGEAA